MPEHEKSKFMVDSVVLPIQESNQLEGKIYIEWVGGFVFPSKNRFEPTELPISMSPHKSNGNTLYSFKINSDYPHKLVIEDIISQLEETPELIKLRKNIKSSRFRTDCNLRSYKPPEDLKNDALKSDYFYTLSRIIHVAHDIIDPTYKRMDQVTGVGTPVRSKLGRNVTGHYLPPGGRGGFR